MRYNDTKCGGVLGEGRFWLVIMLLWLAGCWVGGDHEGSTPHSSPITLPFPSLPQS